MASTCKCVPELQEAQARNLCPYPAPVTYIGHDCNVCTPQAESTPRNLEVGSAYRLSPQSLVSKEARIKLWGITTHIQAKGSKFP